jgi:hypothetical protein
MEPLTNQVNEEKPITNKRDLLLPLSTHNDCWPMTATLLHAITLRSTGNPNPNPRARATELGTIPFTQHSTLTLSNLHTALPIPGHIDLTTTEALLRILDTRGPPPSCRTRTHTDLLSHIRRTESVALQRAGSHIRKAAQECVLPHARPAGDARLVRRRDEEAVVVDADAGGAAAGFVSRVSGARHGAACCGRGGICG